MARSKQETDALKNELRDQIKKINRVSDIGLKYRNVNKIFTQIYNLQDKAEQHKKVVSYERMIRKAMADKIIPERTFLWSNNEISRKYEDDPVNDYSVTNISEDVRKLMDICNELFDEGYRARQKHTEKDINEVYNWEMSQLKTQTYFSSAELMPESWDRNCFKKETEYFNAFFGSADMNEYTFKNEYDKDNSPGDLVAADAYNKARLIQADLKNQNPFWRFFNFRYVAACNEYIATVKNTLARIGFKESQHGKKAIETLKNTLAWPHSGDVKNVTAVRDKKLEEMRNALNPKKDEQVQVKSNVKSESKKKESVAVNQNNKRTRRKIELVPVDDNVRAFGNKLFNPKFMPVRDNIEEQAKMMNAIAHLLKDKPAFQNDAVGKGVFMANQRKIMTVYNVFLHNGAGADNISGTLESINKELSKLAPKGYVPKTVQDYEKAAVNGMGQEHPNNDAALDIANENANSNEEAAKDSDNANVREALNENEKSVFEVDNFAKVPEIEGIDNANVSQKNI